MTHRSTGISILLVALLVVGGAAVWWWQGRGGPASRSGAETPAGAPSGTAPAASASAVDATPPDAGASQPDATSGNATAVFDTPLPDGPIGDTYAELVRRANAGDGLAAMALARTLALCVDYTPGQREKIEDDLVEFAAHAHETPGEDGAPPRASFVDVALDVLDLRDAACPGIENLGIEDRTAERDRWFALGLDLGHPAALVQEANDMLKKRYPRRADTINHAEELRALRPQAMAMLQRAAAQGEPLALLRTATAHRSGDLAARDPVAAYAYLLAYRAGSPAPDVPAVMVDGLDRAMAEGLTAEQIGAAEARAEQIRALCCSGG